MVGQRLTRRFAALALVAGLGLTGCGSLNDPSVAARVGDETIPVSFLQEQVREGLELVGANPNDTSVVGESQRNLLRVMIDFKLAAATGERLGVRVTQADIDREKRELRQQQRQIPRGLIDEYARFLAYSDELAVKLLGRRPASVADQQEVDLRLRAEVAKTAREVGVEVNPRYGRWEGLGLAPLGGQLVRTRGEVRP
ncbi:hypothetical protein [Thermasporomyces composti]|uniref:SurA-like protein n=1 Tax=Thermasporomyces composti TaxID=696763 RepID=A0A3D9V688_THECX|nr:hypothetical protein [Thermasporomyces composti]REF35690.1 hypothetical protein DFJ64_1076 [Thermasporomyces composti]